VRSRPRRLKVKSGPRWGYLASLWASLFALLHLFWALGGSWLLASSAGAVLARDRPTWFVIVGLWGVALLLVVGVALSLTLARRRIGGHAERLLALLSVLVGACLLLRGLGIELLLLTDTGGIASNVGPEQTHLSLVLWNPWFVIGGLAFAAAGVQGWLERERRASSAATDAMR